MPRRGFGGFVQRIRRAFLFPLGPDTESLLELASDAGLRLGLLSDVDPAMVLGDYDGDDGDREDWQAYADRPHVPVPPPVCAPPFRRPKRPTTDPERELQQPQKEKTTMGALEIQNTSEITMPWTAWFLYGSMGAGKCLGKGTPVLRYDGRIVPVEEVRAGDLLMGPDSQPRCVEQTNTGRGPLVLVKPTKGAPWVCNDVHVMTLVDTRDGEVRDMALDAFRAQSSTFRAMQKLFRTGVDFAPQREALPIDPYLLGVWFGDGSKSLGRSGEIASFTISKHDQEVRWALEELAKKFGEHYSVTVGATGTTPTYSLVSAFRKNAALDLLRATVGVEAKVPHAYLTASREARRAFLAGWLDTDGSLGRGCFDFIQKRKDYAEAVCFLARSLGLAAYMREKYVELNGERLGPYWRVSISGEMSTLPLRIPRKQASPRRQRRDPMRTGFELLDLGEGDYYGFTLEGDGRFLLGDFTVTHNTRAAATFPDPLFILPANENSHLTLAQLKEQNIPYITIGKRPDGTPVKARQHLSEVLTELDRRHGLMRQCYAKAAKEGSPDARAALEAEAVKHFPWQTIVGDALTHLGDLLVDDVSNQGQKKMDQQGWGIVSNEYRTLHSRLRNMDVHVVYTALAKTQEAEGGGVTSGGPNLIGAMAEKLPSACDVVVYMEELAGDAKNGPTYRAFLRKYRWWQARTRFGGFPDFMDSFDFRKLEPKIVGSAAAVSAQAAPPA